MYTENDNKFGEQLKNWDIKNRPNLTWIGKHTTRNQTNRDAKNDVDERCVGVDHFLPTCTMTRREKCKIKFNKQTFRDVWQNDVAESNNSDIFSNFP